MAKNIPHEPTVLLAEDNPEHQYITRGLLEECGCRVVEATNGEDAVGRAGAVRFDMILLDLRLPIMDGYEAARRIRKLPRMGDVPMIAYTAYYSYSLSDDASTAGFDEYIVKPVTFEEMKELIDRYFPDRAEKSGKG